MFSFHFYFSFFFVLVQLAVTLLLWRHVMFYRSFLHWIISFACVLSPQWCLTLLELCGVKPTRLIYPWDSFQARVLEWVAISSFRVSSRPRDWTRVSCVSCIGRQILYNWATWEAWLLFIYFKIIFYCMSSTGLNMEGHD